MGYPCVTLKVPEWPTLDQAMWNAALVVDLLGDMGRAAHWSTATRNQVAKDYGRWLFWLGRRGELDPEQFPGNRFTDDLIRAYVDHLSATGMASTSLHSRVLSLERGISVIDPGRAPRSLKVACAKLKRRRVPTRNKHLRIEDPSIMVDRVLGEYDRLRVSKLTVRPCNHARDAVMLVFLCYIPVRRESFKDIVIGEHVILRPDGSMRISLPAGMVKENRPYDADIGEDLLPYLEHYIREVRPVILKNGKTDLLWVSMQEGGMTESAVYDSITKVTARLMGHPLNPHLIRDCVMTFLAEVSPASVRAGAWILGHADLRTSETHYNHACQISAQRRYLPALERCRNFADDVEANEE